MCRQLSYATNKTVRERTHFIRRSKQEACKTKCFLVIWFVKQLFEIKSFSAVATVSFVLDARLMQADDALRNVLRNFTVLGGL